MTYKRLKTELFRKLYSGSEPVNPKPHYSWLMSAQSFVAVYKAHLATDNSYRSWGGFDLHDWRNLSYATERGIVFG